MFAKSKSAGEDWRLQPSKAMLHPSQTISSIGSETMVVGKILCNEALNIYGLIEGEVIASSAFIADGAQVHGDIIAEELIVGGRVNAIFMLSASSCRRLLLSRATSLTGRCRSMSMRGSKDAHGRRAILPNHNQALSWKTRPHSRGSKPWSLSTTKRSSNPASLSQLSSDNRACAHFLLRASRLRLSVS